MVASRLLSFLILNIISLIYTCIYLCSVTRLSVKMSCQNCTISVHFNSMTYFVFISEKSLKSIGSKSVLWPDCLWKLLAKNLLLWLVHCNSVTDFVFISKKILKNIDCKYSVTRFSTQSALQICLLFTCSFQFWGQILCSSHRSFWRILAANLFCGQIFCEHCLSNLSSFYLFIWLLRQVFCQMLAKILLFVQWFTSMSWHIFCSSQERF